MRAHILFVACCAAPLSAQAVPAPFVSPGAVATLQCDGPAAFREAFADTNVARLLDDARVRGLYGPMQAAIQMGLRMAQSQAQADLIDLYEILLDYRGRITVSFDLFSDELDLQAPSPPPMGVVIALAPDGETDLADVAAILGDAASIVPATQLGDLEIGGVTLRAVRDRSGDGMTIPRLIDGHLVMFAGSNLDKTVEHFMAARQSGRVSKASADASIDLRINATRALALALQAAQTSDDDPEEAAMIGRLFEVAGLNNVREIGLRLMSNSKRVVFEGFATFDGAPSGYFGIWQPERPGDGTLARAIPAAGTPAWGFQTIRPRRVVALIRDVMAAMAPQAPASWDEITADFERETGASLENDAVAHLGQHFLVLADPSFFEALARDEEMPDGFCMAMAVQNAAAMHDTLIGMIERETGPVPEPEQVSGVAVYRFPAGPTTVSLAIDRGYAFLAIGNRGSALLESALAETTKAPDDREIPAGVAERLEVAPAGWDSAGAFRVAECFEPLVRIAQETGELPQQPAQIAKLVLGLLAKYDLEHAVMTYGFAKDRFVQTMIW